VAETESAQEHRGGEPLSTTQIAGWREQFEAKPQYRVMQNAVTQVPINDVALNRHVVTGTDHTFSHVLDRWKATNQKSSGRCWIFAGLNLFRAGAMKQMKLKDFEFSQNYTMFWDKLERANYFLEAIIDTADQPVDDRTVAFLLSHPVDDGGQWTMFVNVVAKHGVVPKPVMPETHSSSRTGPMNEALVSKLRQGARSLRDAQAKGAAVAELQEEKNELLEVVYRVLCMHLGTPPEQFDWQWSDSDRDFHRDGLMTPQGFAEKYITLPVNEYVCLVNDPRETSPYARTFTVERLGNVVGGEIVKYLNVEMPVMKDVAMRTLLDAEPVWFGCDVGHMLRNDLGIWDAALFDYEAIYDTSLQLDKAQRLLYHEAFMTHAMLFTGVDVVAGRPRRWRVENSWGGDSGRNGFYVMNDSWFDEHMFEIAARKSYLSDDLQKALETEPIVLPPWDPMGALA